jgi:hypothetical protein
MSTADSRDARPLNTFVARVALLITIAGLQLAPPSVQEWWNELCTSQDNLDTELTCSSTKPPTVVKALDVSRNPELGLLGLKLVLRRNCYLSFWQRIQYHSNSRDKDQCRRFLIVGAPGMAYTSHVMWPFAVRQSSCSC